MARHVKRGDQVMVTSGNNKGQVGEILSIDIEGDRVVVSGINVRKRNLNPTQQRPQGGQIEQEMPIHISNVSPVVEGRPSRVRFETKADGSKVRVAVRGGKELHVLRGPRKG
jgi:large subunit ribosomal protein L24